MDMGLHSFAECELRLVSVACHGKAADRLMGSSALAVVQVLWSFGSLLVCPACLLAPMSFSWQMLSGISRTAVPYCRFAANDAAIVFIFAVIALELKYRAPKAHTMLEM